jgi:hypothetical protein
VKTIAATTLVLLVIAVTAIASRSALFDAYSRNFGSLSPAEFESTNARMDLLETIARFSLLALAGADIALVVAAYRNRAFVIFGLGIALAIVLALFFLMAQAAVGPAMIGRSEPWLVRRRVPEYSYGRGNPSQVGTLRGLFVGARGVELLLG